MVALLDCVSAQLGALGGGVARRPRRAWRSPAPRAGTGPSSAPAPRGSTRRPTSAGRRGGEARSSARGPARSAPRSSASRIVLLVRAAGSQENSGAVRPQAHDIAVPPFPPGTEWVGAEPGAGRADLRPRPAARPLRRRGAPVERPHPPVRGRLGGALPRSRADRGRGQLAPLSVHGRRRQARRGADAARGRLPRRGRLRLPDLARLRMRGVAVAVPLGPRRGAALVSLRRGRVRGHRGRRSRRSCGPSTRSWSCPSPSLPFGPATPPARSSRRPATRSSRAARSPSRGERAEGDPPLELDYAAGGAWATIDGRGALRVSLDGGRELAIEVEAPGAYELAAHERHEAHHLSFGATPGVQRLLDRLSRPECPDRLYLQAATRELGGISAERPARP